MRDCPEFENRLLAGIPYRFRYGVESILRAFQRSQVMLYVYSQAVESAPPPVFTDGRRLMIVAFGSFGRLDGAPGISDYDTILLYSGSRSNLHRDILRDFLRRLVSANQALHFDHRQQLEDGSFDFDASPAYPVLAIGELAEPRNECRVVQLLTEGRIVLGAEVLAAVRSRLIRDLGFSESNHSLDLSPIRDVLERSKTQYCTAVIGRLVNDDRPLKNRKILKLFGLREFFYLSTLFALVDIAIGVACQDMDTREACKLISAPSVLKLASFANPSAPLGILLGSLRPELRHELRLAMEARVQQLPPADRIQSTDAIADSEETALFASIRALALPVLSCYDGLLQLLHDPEFLALIDPLEPDVTTWMAIRHFRRVTALRSRLIDSAKSLAAAMGRMLAMLPDSVRSGALDDARVSLQTIQDYDVQLGPSML